MNRRILLSLLGAVIVALYSLARADPPEVSRADPRVGPLLAAVDAGRIARDIERLAAFGTRNTLSATDDPVRGIGAAQRWVHQELERISAAAGGRLRVEDDPFTVGVADGFPRTVQITNTVATLPGTDPNRVLVVSGHLDSRGTDVMNGKVDAPGADDDASGVAAVLEMARLLGSQQLRATLVFMAVSGEEQGLYGSSHWAQAARAQKRNIEAMFTNDIIGSGHGANGVQDTEHVRLFWRETYAADWQRMSYVGDANQTKLSVTSDGQPRRSKNRRDRDQPIDGAGGSSGASVLSKRAIAASASWERKLFVCRRVTPSPLARPVMPAWPSAPGRTSGMHFPVASRIINRSHWTSSAGTSGESGSGRRDRMTSTLSRRMS
jgi:Peptidase family M28